MGLARIQIKKKPERLFPINTNLCLGTSLAKKLKITGRTFGIKFGTARAVGHLWMTPQKNNTIFLTEQLANQLLIQNASTMYAQFDQQSLRLRLGPLLGILIDTPPSEKQKDIFGFMTKFLEECAQAGKNHGVQVVVLLPATIHVKKRQMQGWIFYQGQWLKTTLPLPDVIYNRITSRKVEAQKDLQTKLGILRKNFHISIFNETFLNKWQVHLLLAKEPALSSILPTTQRYQRNHLRKMLLRYPIVYLKPTNGSLGKGIIRLIKSPTQIYYQSSTSHGTTTLKFRSMAECLKVVSQRIGNQSYLMQRGLNLATYDGRQVDFRVLVQKNYKGIWSITSVVARIANDHHFVSNLARGGTIRNASEVLKDLNISPKPSLKKLKTTSLMIAKRFEQLADGHFAELGIDLALDKNGKIWLIEMNSKPSKTDDSVINPTNTIRPSVNKLIHYIHYLTHFHSYQTGSLSRKESKRWIDSV